MALFFRIVERSIVIALIIMMIVVLLLATVDLGWLIVQDILSPPMFLLEVEELLNIFSFFLLVLIAIARKVITLDVKDYPSLTLVGIAAIVVALAVAFYFVKRTATPRGRKPLPGTE